MVKWRMKSGKFYFQGQRYGPGDEFEAFPYQVQGLRHLLEPLEEVDLAYMIPSPEDVPRRRLQAVHQGFGRWDVINTETDKPINDRPLTKKEARHMVEKILQEEEEKAAAAKEEEEKAAAASLPELKEEGPKDVADDDAGPGDSEEKAPGDPEAVEGKRRVSFRRRTKSL